MTDSNSKIGLITYCINWRKGWCASQLLPIFSHGSFGSWWIRQVHYENSEDNCQKHVLGTSRIAKMDSKKSIKHMVTKSRGVMICFLLPGKNSIICHFSKPMMVVLVLSLSFLWVHYQYHYSCRCGCSQLGLTGLELTMKIIFAKPGQFHAFLQNPLFFPWPPTTHACLLAPRESTASNEHGNEMHEDVKNKCNCLLFSIWIKLRVAIQVMYCLRFKPQGYQIHFSISACVLLTRKILAIAQRSKRKISVQKVWKWFFF